MRVAMQRFFFAAGPLVGGVACVEGGPGPEETAAAAPTRTPTAPVWSAEEAVQHLDAALALGVPEPTHLAAAYAGAVLQGEPACPGLGTSGATVPGAGVWSAECETASGWGYSGSALYEDAVGEGSRTIRITSSFTITDPDGGRFRGGGEVLYASTTDASGTAWTGQVGGEFGWSGQPGWLGAATSEALYLVGTDAGATASLRLDGGVSSVDATLGFTGLHLDSAACAGDSPVASPGRLHVRDPGGAWFVLDLPGDCTGCGALSQGGTAHGEGCVSLAAGLDAARGDP